MALEIKEFVSWLGIIGIPSLFTIVMFLLRWFVKSYKQMRILAKATQAQMRSQLLKDYNKYVEQGWIYDSDLDDWENAYQSYHALGSNGVMDAKRAKILQLPTKADNR